MNTAAYNLSILVIDAIYYRHQIMHDWYKIVISNKEYGDDAQIAQAHTELNNVLKGKYCSFNIFLYELWIKSVWREVYTNEQTKWIWGTIADYHCII